MEIEYGIQINTSQTTITDYDIGVIAGVIRWTTGRPERDFWKEGMISRALFSPVSQEIEIAAGGSYATMSGFSFAVKSEVDGVPLWKRIEALGLNLVQKEIIFYTFRDGVATQDWTGRIGDYDSDEHEFRIQAMDAFRSIHKAICKTKVNSDAFPNAPPDSIGKSIPVTLGLVAHAKLLNITSATDAIECARLGSTNYEVCACTSYNTTTLEIVLKTGRMVFDANDADLVGRYLTVVKGYGGSAAKQSRRIVSNTASTGTGADTGTTTVVIADAFDLGSSTNNTGADTSLLWSSGHRDGVWFFEVNQFDASLAVSVNDVKAIELNAAGRSILEYYDEDKKAFVDISDILEASSASNINSTGYPGVQIISKRVGVDGDVAVFFKMIPDSITYVSFSDGGDWDSLSHDGNTVQARLIDVDQSTDVTITGSFVDPGFVTTYFVITYDVAIPAGALDMVFDALYLLPDVNIVGAEAQSGPNFQIAVKVSLYGKDIYGSVSGTVVNEKTIYSSGIRFTTTPVNQNVHALHYSYYGLTSGSATDFYAQRADLDIQPLIEDLKASVAYPSIRVAIRYDVDTGGSTGPDFDGALNIKELGFVGTKNLNVISSDLFSRVRGETFQSTWGGRKTAGEHVVGVVDALEHIIREYDGGGDYIDTDSFDDANSVDSGRLLWKVGRQISEETNTFDLCEELARFGWFGIIPKNNGKRGVVPWLNEGIAAVATHDSTNIIHGSIGPRTPTSLSKLGNELEVKHSYNPATKKYDGILRITRIDEDTFPAEADPEWKTYAIGFPDAFYSIAADCWNLCHLSYQRYGLIQTLPASMSECIWSPDSESGWSASSLVNSIAINHIIQMAAWTPFRKDTISYHLPNTATHAALELLDKVTFNDAFATDGEDATGWIVRKAIVPGDGQDGKDYIEITLMLAPNIEY